MSSFGLQNITQENIPLIQKLIKKERNGNSRKTLGNIYQNRPRKFKHAENINTLIVNGLNYQTKRNIM